MLLPELIQLSETVFVDDLLERTVVIVTDAALVVEDHHLAILGCIGFPFRQALDVGIPGVCECGPYAAHEVGERQVFFGGVGQLVLGVVQRVEAELQFMSVL